MKTTINATTNGNRRAYLPPVIEILKVETEGVIASSGGLNPDDQDDPEVGPKYRSFEDRINNILEF